jgi:lipoyl(octanoyl) transferase
LTTNPRFPAITFNHLLNIERDVELAVKGSESLPEVWRLICDPPFPGEVNMRRDLELMAEVASGKAPPTLRLYHWSPPALTLGRFQKAEEVADLDACRRLGVDLVRRPTGGRAVLHHRELTYSISVPECHRLIPAGVIDAYRLINQGILAAFEILGIDVSLAGESERGAGLAPGSCFDSTSAYEIRVAGKKVVGSAQLRTGGALLQHGAILLELSLDLYRQLLLPRQGSDNPAYLDALGREAAGLNDLGYPVTPEQLAEALVAGFSEAFSIEFGDIEII